MFENIFEGGETMRKFKVLSTVCLILLLTASTAFGAVSSTPDIELMAEYYSTASASISLSGSTAEVTGKICVIGSKINEKAIRELFGA